jgi:hypothetical protein
VVDASMGSAFSATTAFAQPGSSNVANSEGRSVR